MVSVLFVVLSRSYDKESFTTFRLEIEEFLLERRRAEIHLLEKYRCAQDHNFQNEELSV